MFCTEMDGIESLSRGGHHPRLQSRRSDRPGHPAARAASTAKSRSTGPTSEGAREIFKIYLTPNLPYDPDARHAKPAASPRPSTGSPIDLIEAIFSHRDENRFLTITLRSGKKETLYRGDLISGAIIASIVERAKGLAIKRAIASKQEEGISEADLRGSLDAEYLENDIFPPSDITEDWLQLIDYDPENVVKVSPVRTGSARTAPRSPVV